MSGLSLLELLSEYTSSGIIPMHMPGHKRNIELLGTNLPYQKDITEIPGFDNLQNSEGILKETALLAAKIYGSGKAYLSVNGSTGGILAAIHACTRPHDRVIMARNCHKSVYNAIEMNMLRPVYIAAPMDEDSGITGSIESESVRTLLKKTPDAKLITITSPTYEGISSDIRNIAAAAHEYNVPLLVDAAHGAHLGFSDYFAESAVQAGADIVVMSLHKTLPALTQCALIHLQGSLVSEAAVQNALNIFQTSSPSYILLSSIDYCLRLIQSEGTMLFSQYELRLRKFGEDMRGLRCLRLLCGGNDAVQNHPCICSFDPGKLVILTQGTDIDGPQLAALLRTEYRIETEMAAPDYIIAVTGICDTDESFKRLAEALLEIDKGLKKTPFKAAYNPCFISEYICAPCEALGMEGEMTALEGANGRISLEYVWLYPPGIPLIIPGEVIPEWLPDTCRRLAGIKGISLHSTNGGLPDGIFCKKTKTEDDIK